MTEIKNISYKKKSNYLEKLIGLNSEKSIIWSFFQYEDHYYNRTEVSSLPICTLRKLDYIVLIESKSNRDIWNWAKKVFNYSDSQVFWIEDYVTKNNIESAYESSIQKYKHLKDSSIVISHMTPNLLRETYERHKINYFDMKSLYHLPDKRWLYPTVPGCKVKSPWEYTFPKNVNTPRGYACYSDEELVLAKKLLEENYGIKNFIVKIPNGFDGLFTFSVNNEEEFKDFFKEQKSSEFDQFEKNFQDCWIIEEKLDIKVTDPNKFFWMVNVDLEQPLPVNECFLTEVFGEEITECCHVYIQNQYYNGYVNRVENEKILKSMIEQTQNLMKEVIKFNPGFACIDFLYDNTQEKLFLTDINVGRLSGCFNVFYFFEMYADHSKVMSVILDLQQEVDIFLIYDELVKRGSFFDFDKKEGIMICIPGLSEWAGLILISKDYEGLRNLKREYNEAVQTIKDKEIELKD